MEPLDAVSEVGAERLDVVANSRNRGRHRGGPGDSVAGLRSWLSFTWF
jgi:hypothetical protein